MFSKNKITNRIFHDSQIAVSVVIIAVFTIFYFISRNIQKNNQAMYNEHRENLKNENPVNYEKKILHIDSAYVVYEIAGKRYIITNDGDIEQLYR